MRNPLSKRLPRELFKELGKYMVIFIFMTLLIGFVSGFLVAGGSMITAYDESFDKYNIEDGHFLLEEKAAESVLKDMEKESLSVTEDFYIEEKSGKNMTAAQDNTLRIFVNRKSVNKVCRMEGELPKRENEIAIDRMYADNNSISVGERIRVGAREMVVTGLVALSDYSALFSDNGDMMFDAVKFGVAVVTEEGMAAFGDDIKQYYQYEWIYEKAPANEAEEKEKAEDLMKVLAKSAKIKQFVPRYANQAIQFTGDDMGGDKSMMIALLYILIVILAFVFSVTIRHTIVREATVIGTMRAMGYTKGELVRHYLAIPMLVTGLAAIVGNILGYTVFKNIVADMYYGSYSLPTYVTIWNGEAFILTTVVPVILMFITNIVSLIHSLQLSPLQFIRRDLRRTGRKKAIRLPAFSFFVRFRIRIILQNISGYLTLFVGIVFANVLLLFGMMMSPLLSNYQKEVITHMPAAYQYVLKTQVETKDTSAERFCITSLKYREDGEDEEISVYGIVRDSRYIRQKMPEKGVCISEGIAEKYRIKKGDILSLQESYGTKEYPLPVADIIDYPAGMAVFMSDNMFVDVFEPEVNMFDIGFSDLPLLLHRMASVKEGIYFNGYFSERQLTDIREDYIDFCITEEDMTKLSRQMDVSMGQMFQMVNVFAVSLFVLLVYLLTKLVLEKNTTSISMIKILGYENGEIARLYLIATTWVVIVSIAMSLFLATEIMQVIYRQVMKGFNGWLTLYIGTDTYCKMFLIGVLAYLAVAFMQLKKIQRIPMEKALKSVE